MKNGRVIHYADDAEHPRAEVVLRNGDCIHLTLDRDGLVIRHVRGVLPSKFLFKSEPDMTARLCAALCDSTAGLKPLGILVAAVTQLNSAKEVTTAFASAGLAVLHADLIKPQSSSE